MLQLEELEIQLLLEGIYRYYGFDFRNYAMASLKRRIRNMIRAEKLNSVSALLEKVLHQPECMERLLLGLSVNVTSMFRDPSFYIAFRTTVIPLLRTYPFIRIWHAGCATGEEVYSLAILLYEENLYHRCRIYGTDINESALRKAKAGIYPLHSMRDYSHNYFQAGGHQSLADYYTAAYDNAIIRSFLKENIVFSGHNLVTDASFNEFNVILCRNVLIYFNQELQEQVHKLLYDSLRVFGILGLEPQETLKMTPYEYCYEELDSQERIYRKIA